MGFFDDISKKMSDTKKSIAATTEKMEREAKIKKEIYSNKQTIEKTYSEIGTKVYEAKGNISEISDFINEKVEYIDSLVKTNEERKAELLRLNKKRVCPECGTEISTEAAFCPNCGKEQEKIVSEPEAEVLPKGKVRCSVCNEIIDEGVAFCPICGSEQKKEEKEEAKEPDEIIENNTNTNNE